MSRSIFLVIKTKTAYIDSGFRLTCDAHVDLAYRLVESGMYSSMGKKHWLFAIGHGGQADATAPMYVRKEAQNGLTRYEPRIPANRVRGSFNALLVGLELFADAEGRRESGGHSGQATSDAGGGQHSRAAGEVPAPQVMVPEKGTLGQVSEEAGVPLPEIFDLQGEIIQTEDGPVYVEWEETTTERPISYAAVSEIVGSLADDAQLVDEQRSDASSSSPSEAGVMNRIDAANYGGA